MTISAYYIPTVNLLGSGTVQEIGDRVKTLGGSKVLIITDAGLIKMGMADKRKKII